MVKEIIKKEWKRDLCDIVITYQCEVCGKIYNSFLAAKQCENKNDKHIPESEPVDTGSRPYFLPVTPYENNVNDRNMSDGKKV
ncbi:MAG: hypothetical protein FWD37_02135 [Methanomassiliicoccaceae archaeon]|nr:hypothetical protein [Methanomassiliicoccaceae archaeon]